MSNQLAAPGVAPGAVLSCADVHVRAAPAPALHAGVTGQSSLASRFGAGSRWVIFIALSMALHASILMSGPRATRQATALPGASNVVEVRLIGIPAADSPRQDVRAEAEWKPLQPLPEQQMRRTRMLDFMPLDSVAAEINESDYLPISRVTLRPVPITPIAVPYPPGARGGASTDAKVVLFIDDDGRVAKVALAKDQVATPFAMSAKATFERVRYRPAQLDGKPVKVRVVVAVTFEDRQSKP